jgi:hypothetical protein
VENGREGKCVCARWLADAAGRGAVYLPCGKVVKNGRELDAASRGAVYLARGKGVKIGSGVKRVYAPSEARCIWRDMRRLAGESVVANQDRGCGGFLCIVLCI